VSSAYYDFLDRQQTPPRAELHVTKKVLDPARGKKVRPGISLNIVVFLRIIPRREVKRKRQVIEFITKKIVDSARTSTLKRVLPF